MWNFKASLYDWTEPFSERNVAKKFCVRSEGFGKKHVGQATDLLLCACFKCVSNLSRETEGLKKWAEQVWEGLWKVYKRLNIFKFERVCEKVYKRLRQGRVSNYSSEYFPLVLLHPRFCAADLLSLQRLLFHLYQKGNQDNNVTKAISGCSIKNHFYRTQVRS